jgi:hypothetical protein
MFDMDQDFLVLFSGLVLSFMVGSAAIDRVAVWGFVVFFLAGIRDLFLVLHALPLCGAAPTFLCRGVTIQRL